MSGIAILECPSCEGTLVSGSVICESCGGTCFYENTTEEKEAYMEAWEAWNRKKAQKEIDEIEEQERLMKEEVAKAKRDYRDERNGFYGNSSTKSPLTVLRKMTAKVLKHRRAWADMSAAGAEYRLKHAGIGGTGFSAVRDRTSPWVTDGQFARLEELVIVKSGDIAYFFYSALLDSAGTVVRADGIPSGKAKDVWIAITAVFYPKDFTELAQRIASMYKANRTREKYDEFLEWFWAEFKEGLHQVPCKKDRGTFFEDVRLNWDLVEHALYETANYLARYKVKFELEASELYSAKFAEWSSGSQGPMTTRERSSRAGGGRPP